MSKYIKIQVTAKMESDLRECEEAACRGEEKCCEGCSLNGGEEFECMADYGWEE